MGDGVMNINATFFDAFALELTGGDAAADKVTAMLKQIESEMNALAETILALKEEAKTLPKNGTSERLFEIIDLQRSAAAKYNSLSKKHFKLRSDRLKTAPRPVSKWAPGDDPQTRPYGASDYFEGGVAQARSILYHEFAHHVHQMWGKQGPRRTHGEPPLERRLAQMVKSADMSRQLSKYGTTNAKEWFAENFSAYMMGRTDLVDAALITLIEGLLDG
jgi:hypothetical protein